MTDIKEVEKILREAAKGKVLQPLPTADIDLVPGACCILGAAYVGTTGYPSPEDVSLGTELEMASIAYGFDGESESPLSWGGYFVHSEDAEPPIPEFLELGRKFRAEAGYPVKNTAEPTGTQP